MDSGMRRNDWSQVEPVSTGRPALFHSG